MSLDRRLSIAAIAVGLLLRLYVGLTTSGYYFPDEVFQYLEPGHLLAFGRAAMTWEYEYGMRSWVLPTILAGIMRTFDMLGVHDTHTMWRMFRVLAALMSVLVVVAADRMGRAIGGKWVGVTAALLTAIYVPLLDLSPRLLADSLSGTLTVWALARVFTRDDSQRDHAWSGVMFALATVFRLASGVAIVPPFIALVLRRDRRRLLAFCIPLAAVLLLSGAVDWVTWGRPFHSWITYVDMNFVRGVSTKFGTAPNDAYLLMLLRTFDWLYPAALAAIIFGFRNSGLAGWTFAFTYIFISAASHKEFRFTDGMLPLMMVLLANGIFVLADIFVQHERLKRLAIGGAVAIFAMQNLPEVRDQEWGEGKDEQAVMAYIQRMPDIHGLFFGAGRYFPGGEWTLHRSIPAMFVVNPDTTAQDFAIATQTPMLDVWVLNDAGRALLPKAGLNERELRAVHHQGPWTIYRRSTPTSPSP